MYPGSQGRSWDKLRIVCVGDFLANLKGKYAQGVFLVLVCFDFPNKLCGRFALLSWRSARRVAGWLHCWIFA